jgi:hypothetical protein
VAIFFCKPHGMMEWWNMGRLGMKSGKKSILKKCWTHNTASEQKNQCKKKARLLSELPFQARYPF